MMSLFCDFIIDFRQSVLKYEIIATTYKLYVVLWADKVIILLNILSTLFCSMFKRDGNSANLRLFNKN